MKNLSLLVVCFFLTALFAVAEEKHAPQPAPVFSWAALWSGSWEENKTLHNRGEVKLNFLPPSLTLRGEILDRRTFNLELDSPWGDPAKAVTNFAGGLYHKTTGSRLLYGVLDEYGLSARIRNPWIRGAPYAENHKPLMADLKTAASGTKEDEAYLYLSSPFINLSPNTRLRGFASAQTQIDDFTPAVSGGLDFTFAKKTGFSLEAFYTGAQLPPTKSGTWFSYPPPLPLREFDLYAAGFLFYNPFISLSGDFAYSKTFAWGADIYANFGISFTPSLPFGSKTRPLTVSFAMDGAGERFVYRDGAGHGAGFRSAGKIEWKGKGNSLFRINSILRSPNCGEVFNRSSSGIYYRFSSVKNSYFPVRLTVLSFSMDRNAEKPQKITDGFSGKVGFSIKMPEKTGDNTKKGQSSPLGVNFSGSYKGISADENPSPYPFSREKWIFDSANASCELVWSHGLYQIRSKFGYSWYEKKDGKWEFSINMAVRFKYGRFSVKAASPDFPQEMSETISWRLEKSQ